LANTWTPDEDAYLRRSKQPLKAVAEHLGRSIHSVQQRRVKLGLTKSARPWTSEEDHNLKNAGNLQNAIAALPGRSRVAIVRRSQRLGYRFQPPDGPLRRVSSKGYVQVFIRGRWRSEHRVVAVRMLGRNLLPNEHVHHIDGVKDNNDPSNLYVCTNREHARAHKSLLDIRPALLQCGAVTFDHTRGEYVV
jgi:hypothetical protein